MSQVEENKPSPSPTPVVGQPQEVSSTSFLDSEVFLIKPFALNKVWDDVVPLLEPALKDIFDQERYTLEDMLELLKREFLQLWVSINKEIECVCITEIVNYPRLTALRVVILTGNTRENWLGFLDELEKFAKQFNATCIETNARPGWERVLKGKFKKTHVFLERRIE